MRPHLPRGSSVAILGVLLGATIAGGACGGDDTAAPTSTDGGDATTLPDAGSEPPKDVGADTPPTGIRGALTVHGVDATGRIFLGDGSKFNVPVTKGNTTVTFTDAAIVGPQTVSFTTDPALGGLLVFTLAKVDVPEVWLNADSTTFDPMSLASVEGTLDYPTDPAIDRVEIDTLAESGYGATIVHGPFPFAFGVQGPKSTTSIDLLGYASINGESRLRYAGFVPAIPLPPYVADASPPMVTLPTLKLDHVFDQPVSITVPNHALYGGKVNGTIRYGRTKANLSQGQGFGGDLMSTSETFDGPTGTVRSIAMTAPFDTFARFADLSVDGASSYCRIFAPLGANETSLTANVVPSPTVTAPPTSPVEATDTLAPVAFAPGSTVSWTTGDPDAQTMQLDVTARRAATVDGGSGFYFFWTVYVPKGENNFTFFELPANASPVGFFPKGPANLRVSTTKLENTAVAEVFGADVRKVKQLRNARGSHEAQVARRFLIQ